MSPGAVAALVIWLAASAGLAFYSANFGSYDKTWGTLAAVVVTLVWLWLTSAAVLFGAEVNAEARKLAAERVEALGSDGHQRVLRRRRAGTFDCCHSREEQRMDSDRIEGKAKEVEGETQQKWGEAKDKARDTWEDVKDKVEDVVDGAEDRVDEMNEPDDEPAEASASR